MLRKLKLFSHANRGNTVYPIASFSSTSSIQINRDHPKCNVSDAIISKIGRNLHLQQHHPLNILKQKVESYFSDLKDEPEYIIFDNLSPIVPTKRCFDDLLTPINHVSRSVHDTYYIDPETVLRTHTSAHQTEMMEKQFKAFLVTGDVYRRDEIDSSHYPVFHQMEGVRLFPELNGVPDRSEKSQIIEQHLKKTLEGMVKSIFGDVEMRWVDAYFPFTTPSAELEIFFNGDWLEVLGSGIIQQQILRNASLGEEMGWAFGLGLERLAMVLFDIPDIRLFWSQDPRFLTQFSEGKVVRFEPFSKYPPCYKDVSFWHNEEFQENDLYEVVRNVAGDIVEEVVLLDEFVHPKSKQKSKCYRITYRHMGRNLTNNEIDEIQDKIRDRITKKLSVSLR